MGFAVDAAWQEWSERAMVEYYPLLARAVSAQPNASKDTRDGIYDRARRALLGQLRAHVPPLPEDDIAREALALDKAIARIEAEHAADPAIAAAPALKADPAPLAKPYARPQTGSKPMSLADRAQARRTTVAAAGADSADDAKAPGIETARPSETAQPTQAPEPVDRKPEGVELRAEKHHESERAPAPAIRHRDIDAENGRAPVVLAEEDSASISPRGSIPRSGILWKLGRSRAAADRDPIVVPSSGLENAATASRSADEENGTPRDADSTPASNAASKRMERVGEEPTRTDSARPLAPLARKKERRSRAMVWGIGSAATAGIAAVAILAFVLRDSPQTIEAEKTVPAAAEKAPGKIVDRIGVGPTRLSEDPATSGPGPLAVAPPVSSETPSPSAEDGHAASNGPAQATSNPGPAPPAQTAGQVASVAQRAALLVQSPTASDAQAIATYVGTVVWRLDTVTQGAGQPVALAVRAEVDVPDAKFKASMLIEKNSDESLPASHTMELRFMPGPGSPIGDVKQIDTPQMRKEESPAGDALSGIPAPITTNYFLIGLTKGDPAQARNLDLIRTAGWFDVPLLLANGKVAKITFEKGASGQKALSDALASWSN